MVVRRMRSQVRSLPLFEIEAREVSDVFFTFSRRTGVKLTHLRGVQPTIPFLFVEPSPTVRDPDEEGQSSSLDKVEARRVEGENRLELTGAIELFLLLPALLPTSDSSSSDRRVSSPFKANSTKTQNHTRSALVSSRLVLFLSPPHHSPSSLPTHRLTHESNNPRISPRAPPPQAGRPPCRSGRSRRQGRRRVALLPLLRPRFRILLPRRRVSSCAWFGVWEL